MVKKRNTDLGDRPHRRFNPLVNEWVLVSPHRTQRPWQGQTEPVAADKRPAYDKDCYLCPGNTRANGEKNPDFDATFAFTNDFSALLPMDDNPATHDEPLFQARSESGVCRVVCFSPRHDLTVSGMALEDVARVIEVWKNEYEQFVADPNIAYAQIFENKGEMMGCSNKHPHCQIWASDSIPTIVSSEQECQVDYLDEHARPLLLDYVDSEVARKERLVYENNAFVVVVPYWATWPFEALVLPREHRPSLADLSPAEVTAFADAYKTLTTTYDKIFDIDFPYTAGIHQAPTVAGDHSAWQMHMHFYPPLLRSATVKKFMVGYEMLAMPQRDITAEAAAQTLREAMEKK